MKKFSIYSGFWRSFYSRSFYRDVVGEWKGVGIGFLLLLTLLVSVIFAISLQLAVHEGLRDYFPGIAEQVPDMKIEEGQLVVPEDKMYTIKDPESGAVIAIVNPPRVQDAPANPADSPEGAPIVFERTRVVVKNGSVETRSYTYKSWGNFQANSKIFAQWMDVLGTWLIPACFPFIVFGLFVYHLAQALLYAVAILVIGWMMDVRETLDYGVCLRLSCVLMVPGLLLKAVNFSLNLDFSSLFHGWIYVLITLGYCFYAVRSLRTYDDVSMN